MIVMDIVFAFIIALLLSIVLAGVAGWRHPRRAEEASLTALLFLFFILFVATWAGGVWMTPFGPQLMGRTLLPFVVVGLIVALVLAAAAPLRRPRTTAEAASRAEAAAAASSIFGCFFWAVIIMLIASAISAYL